MPHGEPPREPHDQKTLVKRLTKPIVSLYGLIKRLTTME